MKVIYVMLMIISLSACQNKNEVIASVDTLSAVQHVPVADGHGKVTLKCGAETINVTGRCGSVTNSGDRIIALQDATSGTKVFTISFNTIDYPADGKLYTIKESHFSEGKKPANEVYVGLSEITTKNQMDWSSNDASGKLQFKTSGNQVSCTFSNITLMPNEVYNKGSRNQPATISGELTFYKN